MILINQNKPRRRSLKVVSLSIALLIGFGLILQFTTVEAAAVMTTISIQDQNGAAPLAKVTVFDARNGKQIANGQTDPGTGLFTFRSRQGVELLAAVQTATGYVSAARVTAGEFAAIVAVQETAGMQTLMPALDAATKDSLVTTGGNTDSAIAATLTFVDQKGAPIARAQIAVVEWATFEQVGRGHTTKKGRFTFDVPEDMDAADFLVMLWTDDGEISLKAALQTNNSLACCGGETGWPGF